MRPFKHTGGSTHYMCNMKVVLVDVEELTLKNENVVEAHNAFQHVEHILTIHCRMTQF